jgi:hypothetical protein
LEDKTVFLERISWVFQYSDNINKSYICGKANFSDHPSTEAQDNGCISLTTLDKLYSLYHFKGNLGL